MKAIILRGPRHAELASVKEPNAIGEEDVLLRVYNVGLCGSDLNSYRGRNPQVTYPRIPGHEIAATIVKANPKYPAWPAGLAVTVSPYTNCGDCASCLRNCPNACQFNQTLGVQRDGALTEFMPMRVDRLYRSTLSLKDVCLVEPLTVGIHAVARARVAAGDTVAVLGCGGVGLGAVAGAATRGATVIAVDVDEAKLELAHKAGAKYTINGAHDDLHSQFLELTAGRGPDVIVEAVGLPETFRAAVEEVAFSGRVVYIGYAKERVEYETRLFVQKELDILGSRNARPEDFREAIRLLESRVFPMRDVVTHTVEMERAPHILSAWDKAPAQFGKIIVDLS